MRKHFMRRSILTGLIAATLGIAGCAARYVGVYATIPPPPIHAESYGPAPGPGFIWIQGYWGWSSNAYVWVPGQWDRIPPGRHRWEVGRWVRRGNRYYWRDGRWR
jgi:WXXGXW repeat (2 copies)